MALLVSLAACVAGSSSCNRRVFVEVPPVCGPTDVVDVSLSDQPIDVLIVIDNSGSMAEEQARVARAFINPDVTACPIPQDALADFRRCRDEDERPAVCAFHKPSPEQLEGELSACGFLQVLAAFDADFRVGVLTTDVGRCDNRIPDALAGSARSDGDSDIATRFSRTLLRIGTSGSPSERGLDAVDMFFDPAVDREPACNSDAANFMRDDARLAVIFVTDEDDCSRTSGDDGPFSCLRTDQSCAARFEEFADDVCGENTDGHLRGAGDDCYARTDTLTPVAAYAARLRALKRSPDDVSVAVIAGAATDVTGRVIAAGCDTGPVGDAVAGCEPLAGRPRAECPDCCTADPGARYVALAEALSSTSTTSPSSTVASICDDSFQRSMVEIARTLDQRDVVRFADTLTNPDLVFVESDQQGLLTRLDGDDCAGRDGWVFVDDGDALRLCGAARPAPGERLHVRAPLAGTCTTAATSADDE